MKKNNRKNILIVLVAIILIMIVVLVFVNKKNRNVVNDNVTNNNDTALQQNTDNVSQNENANSNEVYVDTISEKMKEDKTFDVYTLSNILVSKDENGTLITAKASSSSNDNLDGREATIKFYDSNGKVILEKDAFVPKLDAGKEDTFWIRIEEDMTGAYNFSIELK